MTLQGWVIFYVRKDHDFPSMCSKVADEACARQMAEAMEKDGHKVIDIRSAQSLLGKPAPSATNEERAAAFRALIRNGDGKPDGTREGLAQCATMLDTYGPECFPANEQGQVHFARAMMESVTDEIRAFLAADTGADKLRAELERTYRALGGFYSRIREGQLPDKTMLAYHSPTVAAARRFIDTGEIGEGSEYFVGKLVEALHKALNG